MNPYSYSQFKEDATEAVNPLIKHKQFKITRIEDWGIWLSDDKIKVQFYFEGVVLQASIVQLSINKEILIYDLFDNKGLKSLFPIDVDNMDYKEWNKYFMQKISAVLVEYFNFLFEQ